MRRYRGFEFRRGVESFARKVASALDLSLLKIFWKSDITTAGVTSSSHLYLADVDDDAVLTHNELLKYCGFVLHELCHIAYTNFNVNSSNDYVRQLHNAVEDAFIERTAINRGLVGNVREVFTVLIDRMVEDALATVSDWSDPRQYPFVLAVYLRKHAVKKVPLAKGLKPIFDEAARLLVSAGNSSDTLDIAEWVYAQLNLLNKPNKQGKQSKPAKGEDKGDSQGDAQGDAEGDAQAEADDGAGNARAPGDHCNPVEVEPNLKCNKRTGYGGTYSSDSGVVPIRQHQRYTQLDLGSTIPGKLRYNLKRLFDNSDYSDFQHNRKFGTVNASALAHHKHSANVFKLRREVEGIDSAVVICIDVSDSMFCDERDERRIKVAVQCASALVDTLRYAQVSTTVLSFGSRVAVLKNWNEGVGVTRERLAHLDSGGSTNDYVCVRYAHDLLLARPEKRKVCLVITDGEGYVTAVTDQVKTGTRLGITTIGVGISLDVSNVYDQHINVEDAGDLGVATFKNIKLAA